MLLGLSLGFGALSPGFEAWEEAEHFVCFRFLLFLCLGVLCGFVVVVRIFFTVARKRD